MYPGENAGLIKHLKKFDVFLTGGYVRVEDIGKG